MRISPLLGLLAILQCIWSGCGSESTDDECKNECETLDWPRLILAIAGPAGGQVDDVQVEYASGARRPADSALCPRELPASLTCTYTAIGAGPITVTVSAPGRASASQMIELADFNYCARDIAYVEIEVNEEETVFHETRYLSPCDLLSLEE
jgi:hypothetical protein